MSFTQPMKMKKRDETSGISLSSVLKYPGRRSIWRPPPTIGNSTTWYRPQMTKPSQRYLATFPPCFRCSPGKRVIIVQWDPGGAPMTGSSLERNRVANCPSR